MKECANCVYYNNRTNNCLYHSKFTVDNDNCEHFVEYGSTNVCAACKYHNGEYCRAKFKNTNPGDTCEGFVHF